MMSSDQYSRMTIDALHGITARAYRHLMFTRKPRNRDGLGAIYNAARRELERRGQVQYWWEQAEEQERLL